MNFICSFCNKEFERKIRSPLLILNLKYSCKDCTNKLLESGINHNHYNILTENKINTNPHLEILSYCSNCDTIVIRRYSKEFVENINDSKNIYKCKKCLAKERSINKKKQGYCTICGIFNKERDAFGRGISECNCHRDFQTKASNIAANIKKSYSKKDKEGNYIDNSNEAIKAREMFINQTQKAHIANNKHIWEREEFYNRYKDLFLLENKYDNTSNKYKCKEINNNDNKIINNNFKSLIGVPGVWAVWDSDKKICFDVAQTKNIGKEMFLYLRKLDYNKDLSDKDIINENKRYFYNLKKYRNIMKDCNKVCFILVSINISSKEERELIEIKYAYDNKARYWNLAPGQLLSIKNFNTKDINSFEGILNELKNIR